MADIKRKAVIRQRYREDKNTILCRRFGLACKNDLRRLPPPRLRRCLRPLFLFPNAPPPPPLIHLALPDIEAMNGVVSIPYLFGSSILVYLRETIGRVAAGAIAKKILKMYAGTEILAYVSQVHKVVLPEGVVDHETLTLDQIENNIVRCPDPVYAQKMIEAIDEVRVKGDSVGGIVTCITRNVPQGLGCSVFDKLEADLAKAMLSLPATKGFEIGSGFAVSIMMSLHGWAWQYADTNKPVWGCTGRNIKWRNHLLENSF
ncbi:hypothetical protein ZIOFF_011772 [Zingiber officinale]|uniref:chorismate synthase n=1 Tax=Zingiber officinale TaxID=94328 RepID=A0A8J5M216_ZINOF|nr:hypothetical protein ZIOFF_011772 [Zingiber officinale]